MSWDDPSYSVLMSGPPTGSTRYLGEGIVRVGVRWQREGLCVAEGESGRAGGKERGEGGGRLDVVCCVGIGRCCKECLAGADLRRKKYGSVKIGERYHAAPAWRWMTREGMPWKPDLNCRIQEKEAEQVKSGR